MSRWAKKNRFVLGRATIQGHDAQRLLVDQIYAMPPTVVCEDHLADPDTVQVFDDYFGVFGDGTRLAMPKTIRVLDSSSLKPGSGATDGVLDKGVSGQPDYILWPDCWTMKIQDSRLHPVSGRDSPLCGRQSWRFGC